MSLRNLFIATALLVSPAAAQEDWPQHAMRTAAPVNPSPDFHISGSSVVALPLAEWVAENRTGRGERVEIVWGQDAVDKAPAKASKYLQKSYVFPTGTIRVMEFKADKGGMLHAITVETAIYMLKGSGTVDVAGQNVQINEGDLVSYPSGVLQGTGDATVIAWTVTGNLINEASPAKLVRSTDAKMSASAEWDQGGKRVRGRTPEELAKAPANAIRLEIQRYDFPGNSVRVTKNYKGGPTSPTTGDQDALIYVVSGKLNFFQDGKDVIALPGDAVREIAGATHHWIRLEDSSFIATSSLPIKPLAKKK